MLSKFKKKTLETIIAGMFFLSSLLPISSKAEEIERVVNKNLNSRPAIVNILNAEVGTEYSGDFLFQTLNNMLEKNIDTTVSIIPNPKNTPLQKQDELVKKLRSLYDEHPDSIEIGLNGYKFTEEEFNNSMYEQLRDISEAQSIFTTAFNPSKSPIIQDTIMGWTLTPPYENYTLDTIKAVRPAGVRIILSTSEYNLSQLNLTSREKKQGFRLNQNGVTEIFNDPEGNIVSDYNPLKIKSVFELMKGIKNEITKDPSSDDPLVITIPLADFTQSFGTTKAKKYLEELVQELTDLKKQNKLNFMLPKEFYANHHKGPSKYLIIRVDDERLYPEQALWHRNTTKKIRNLGISLTDAVIPVGLNKDIQSQKYLKEQVKKSNFELALHGLRHTPYEFRNLSFSQNLNLLKKGLKEFDSLKNYDLDIFIPPYNAFNENTLKAMSKIGMKIISSDNNDKMLFGLDKYGIMHMSNITLFEKKWSFPFDYYTKEEVSKQIKSLNDVVFMIHPQTIINNKKEKKVFETIKKCIDDPDIKVVNLGEYYKAVMPKIKTLELIQSGRMLENRVSSNQFNANKKTLNRFLIKDANIAWNFFKNTLDPINGLNPANSQIFDGTVHNYPNITMWDFGSLLLANISANQIGIISKEEFHTRMSKALNFLETCELCNKKLPGESYDISTKKIEDNKRINFNSTDFGRLLTSMKILYNHHPEFNKQCDKIIKRFDIDSIIKNRKHYDIYQGKLIEESNFDYAQYASKGYQLWGFEVNESPPFYKRKINNIDDLMVFFDKLRKNVGIASEPSILRGIELGHTELSGELSNLIFRAQQQRYEKKGIVTCVSEGALDREPWFVYQQYLINNNSDKSWPVIKQNHKKTNPNLRFVSSKGVFAWYALKENNPYSSFLYSFIKNKVSSPNRGWYSGVYENNNKINEVSDINTNAIILESIWYKIRGNKPLLEK